MGLDWGDLFTAVIAVLVGAGSSYYFADRLRQKDNHSLRLKSLYSVFKEIKGELNSQVEVYWSKGNEGSEDTDCFTEKEREFLEVRLVVSTQQLFKIGEVLKNICPDTKDKQNIINKLLKVHSKSTGGLFQSKNRKAQVSVIKDCRSYLNNINIDFISLL